MVRIYLNQIYRLLGQSQQCDKLKHKTARFHTGPTETFIHFPIITKTKV
jgi:hypothetical protein